MYYKDTRLCGRSSKDTTTESRLYLVFAVPLEVTRWQMTKPESVHS